MTNAVTGYTNGGTLDLSQLAYGGVGGYSDYGVASLPLIGGREPQLGNGDPSPNEPPPSSTLAVLFEE